MTDAFDAPTLAALAALKASQPQVDRAQDEPPRRKDARVRVAAHPVASSAAVMASNELSRAIVTSETKIEEAAEAEVARILARIENKGRADGQEEHLDTGAAEPVASAAPEDGQAPDADPDDAETPDDSGAPLEDDAVGVGLMPHRKVAKTQSLKRFASSEIDPSRVIELDRAHPAVVEGHTIYQASVVGTNESARFLVSGHNNSKLGKAVQKGPWAGMPIYHVTLEERATCPRSCARWLDCYGSGMPFARRNDHRDPLFLEALDREVRHVARAHPQGFVVRLHTLGDFYSMEYLNLWGDLLFDLPNLHVFGYTARREDADDDESREIAATIRQLGEVLWSRFAVRFSNQPGPDGTITLMEPIDDPNVIMCPAQTGATEACATCGLCWSEAARVKTIGFLLHGRKRRQRKEADAPPPPKRLKAPAITPVVSGAHPPRSIPELGKAAPVDEAARNAEWCARYDAGESVAEIAGQFGNQLEVRRGIIAAGGTIRTRSQALALAHRQRRIRSAKLIEAEKARAP